MILAICCFLIGSSVVFFCVSWNKGFVVQNVLSGGVSFDFDYLLCLDSLSVVFGFMLLVCGVIALFYCGHYFMGLTGYWGLAGLMVFFLFTMLLLVFSGSLILTLILWEYLGFVSFLLILYYSTSGSLRSSVVTLVTSRFGDVGLFVVFSWLFNDFGFCSFFFGLCVFLIIATKSACYPFVWWLLEAMRAPTPVSSLVHSSTLVAAGVWFLLRYANLTNSLSVWLVFLSACLTVVLSASCACCEVDVKKLVAFSTCNNISWCLLYMVCGDVLLSVCQLLVHGFCKALLFMSVGDLMVSSGSGQSSVNFYSLSAVSWYGCMVGVVLVSFLCGIPFLGVFFTKHLFVAHCLCVVSPVFLCFLFVSILLTNVYSFRLVLVLLNAGGGLNWGNYVCFCYMFGCIFLSLVLDDWLGGFLEDVVLLNWFWGLVMLLSQVLGFVGGLYLFESSCIFSPSCLWLISGVFGSDVLVDSAYRVHRVLCLCGIYMFRWEVWLCGWVLSLEFSLIQSFVSLCAAVSFLILSSGLFICVISVL